VKQDRLVGLIDQGCDMADIDRLVEVDQLSGLTQVIEKSAK
jgi:hypothetical protein